MKFNKHIGILLTLLILASNMGMALNVHYCGGEVASVSLAYRTEKPCAEKKEKKMACCAAAGDNHKGCCKNDLVKLHDSKTDNIIVKSLQLDLSAFYTVEEWKPVHFYAEAPLTVAQTTSFYCDSHAPPLFKLYCQYIFYA